MMLMMRSQLNQQPKNRVIRRAALYLGIALAVVVALLPRPSYAATSLTVASCTESALRQAIANAANGDTIRFSCSGTITLSGGPVGYIHLNKDLTLDGSGQQV